MNGISRSGDPSRHQHIPSEQLEESSRKQSEKAKKTNDAKLNLNSPKFLKLTKWIMHQSESRILDNPDEKDDDLPEELSESGDSSIMEGATKEKSGSKVAKKKLSEKSDKQKKLSQNKNRKNVHKQHLMPSCKKRYECKKGVRKKEPKVANRIKENRSHIQNHEAPKESQVKKAINFHQKEAPKRVQKEEKTRGKKESLHLTKEKKGTSKKEPLASLMAFGMVEGGPRKEIVHKKPLVKIDKKEAKKELDSKKDTAKCTSKNLLKSNALENPIKKGKEEKASHIQKSRVDEKKVSKAKDEIKKEATKKNIKSHLEKESLHKTEKHSENLKNVSSKKISKNEPKEKE